MPGGDRTGPMGMGPLTGRGAGICAGNNRTGWGNRFFGRGLGFRRGGRGGGFGFRSNWGGAGVGNFPQTAAPTQDDEKQWLQERTRALEVELEQLRRRMETMQPEAADQE